MNDTPTRNPEPRQRLGRGLAALLGEAKPASSGDATPSAVREAPIEFIRSNPRNPRQTFVEAELDELAASIREHGIIQPIVVRPITGAQDTYEIIAGERRWRAAQRAGKHTVPIISLAIGDREALEISIIENVQRADLNALEEANGYAYLASDYGYSHADIGRVVGKSRSHVANTLRLLALPESVRDLLSDGSISAGHARALLTAPNPEDLAKRIVANGLTVRDIEKISSGSELKTPEKPNKDSDPHTKDLEQKISLALGASTLIVNNKRVKEIRIKFREFDQLDYICNKLLG
jgi:ParB family chromosome partitioning protein